MKKNFCLLLALLLLFCSGCTQHYGSLKAEYRLSSVTDTSSRDRSNLNFSLDIDNETPYRELLTKEVDIHAFAEKYCTEHGYALDADIEEIANDIGIECLRQIEEKQLYSIHKVKQGGLLYIFYSYIDSFGYLTKDSFYMQKKLSSQDFSFVKLGTTIEELKRVDPTAQIWENLYTADPSRSPVLGCQTRHYLSDGELIIGFKPKDGVLKVFSCGFNAFEADSSYPPQIMEKDWI